MYFKSRSSLINLYVATVYCNNEKPLKYVDTQKYLGIEIKSDLTSDLNIMRQVKVYTLEVIC